ncbi:MAG: hypothetical protein ACTSYQ_02990 [Candidatus Odinarchaeia archaeon]
MLKKQLLTLIIVATVIGGSLGAVYFILNPGVIPLENYDWSEGPPSWQLIDANAQGLTRNYPTYLKGARFGNWVTNGTQGDIIQSNFEIKERIHANLYALNLVYIYENGTIHPIGEDTSMNDTYLRYIMAEGILAKRAGFAVYLMARAFPGTETPVFDNWSDMLNCLNLWKPYVETLATLAEKYKFEYFDPYVELDNVVRVGTMVFNETATDILNQYYSDYLNITRQHFNGKVITQIAGVGEWIANLTLSDYDMVGCLITNALLPLEGENNVSTLMETYLTIMEEYSTNNSIPWVVSELWIYYAEGYGIDNWSTYQKECYQIFFNLIEGEEITNKPSGVIIMDWNWENNTKIKDTLAEAVVAENFQ